MGFRGMVLLFLGLKAKIAATLVVLLLAGMLLVNLVVVFFWQRSLIQSEINHAEAVVRLWSKKNSNLSPGQFLSRKNLQELCLAVGPSCENVVLFNGKSEYDMNKENKYAVSSLLRKSYLDEKPVKQTAGLTWNLFTYGGKHLYHVLPLKIWEW